jgi:hypothetical protein
MHIIVLIIWIVSLVVLAFEPATRRPFTIGPLGLFLFDLWIGLQFLMEVTDPIRL